MFAFIVQDDSEDEEDEDDEVYLFVFCSIVSVMKRSKKGPRV